MSASFARSYTFEEAYEEAEVVAWIKIEDRIREDERCTFFDASVVECYKGENIGNFIYVQSGNSKYTYSNCPILAYGNQMLVFLKSDFDDYGNKIYGSMNCWMSFFDITWDDDRTYVFDRYGMFGVLDAKNYLGTTTDARAKLLEIDPLTMNFLYKHVYDLEDVKKIFESYEQK